MSRSFKSIRRQRSSLPLIVTNVAKFWGFLSGSIFPMQVGRAKANKHLKKMATDYNMLDLQKLYPLEYLWFIRAACNFFLENAYLPYAPPNIIPHSLLNLLRSSHYLQEFSLCFTEIAVYFQSKEQSVSVVWGNIHVYARNHTDRINTSLQRTIHLLLL
jgi:hypothetical protein